MALYGSLAGIQTLLTAAQSGGDDFSTFQVERMIALQATVSLLIEQQTGCTFGVAEDALDAAILYDGEGDNRLFLDPPLRSITSLIESPDWDGEDWTGGTTLAVETYRLVGPTRQGAYQVLLRLDGAWGRHRTYLITGTPAGAFAGEVPNDITYIANYLSAELFKKQPQGPAGAVGVDGLVVPLRNAFSDPEVRATLEKYQLGPAMFAVL